MAPARPRWGDTVDEDDILPNAVVKGPDEHGIKTVVDYYRNDKSEAIKKTTKYKIVTVERKVYKVGILHCYLPASPRSRSGIAGTAGRLLGGDGAAPGDRDSARRLIAA